MEAERLGQRPAVLEGVEAARLEQGRTRQAGAPRAGAARGAAADPGADGAPVEARDGPGDLVLGGVAAQTSLVPRGPNSHLWHPATRKSQPRPGASAAPSWPWLLLALQGAPRAHPNTIEQPRRYLSATILGYQGLFC
jgi:hypothetical protein